MLYEIICLDLYMKKFSDRDRMKTFYLLYTVRNEINELDWIARGIG